ncbi:MAG: hypothetical protein EXR77_12435 [Myxococcales bacterium]|nr:hypothetical protein [Myxococcales bacterium]
MQRAAFLAPLWDWRPLPARQPPWVVVLLLRWLSFRIMLGAGLIKGPCKIKSILHPGPLLAWWVANSPLCKPTPQIPNRNSPRPPIWDADQGTRSFSVRGVLSYVPDRKVTQ